MVLSLLILHAAGYGIEPTRGVQMRYIEDTLTLEIEDVDDFVRVWIKNDKGNSLKFLEEFDAEYKNSVHGYSKGKLSKHLINGNNYIIIGAFNKVFNGKVNLKFLPFPAIFKGGKTSYALSFFLNQEKIWSCFKFRSDHSIIEALDKKTNDNPKKKVFSRLSDYFGSRTKEEEDALVGIKYLHIFNVIKKNKQISFLEVYYKDFTSNETFKVDDFDNSKLELIYNDIMKFNSEFIIEQRYADGKTASDVEEK